MAQISARTATFAKWAAIPVALLVSGVAVSQASYSAFSATTATPENSWKAGTVALNTQTERATAMFTATDLKPGSTGYKCITVTSTGSLASTVKLYATNYSSPARGTGVDTTALGDWIKVTVTQGIGGAANCTDFKAAGEPTKPVSLKTLGTDNNVFSAGISPWTTIGTQAGAAAETRTYRIDYELDLKAPNTTQEGTASVGFTWEAQNN